MGLLYKAPEKTADFTDHDTFGSAFKAARSSGAAVFSWNGKKYSTEMRKKKSPAKVNIAQPVVDYTGYGPVAEPVITKSVVDSFIGPKLPPEIKEPVAEVNTLKEVWGDMGHSEKSFPKFINLLGVLGGAESGRGKKVTNSQSRAEGDFQIIPQTFTEMQKRFYGYVKNKGFTNMKALQEERPDLFKILTAKGPLDLTRQEQASLTAVYMTQSDVPLLNFLRSKEGSSQEKDASRQVYKYWVRDFDGAVYGKNQHMKNWDNNLKYLSQSKENMKYMQYQGGGVTTKIDVAKLSKIPNLTPPSLKDKVRLGKKSSPIIRGGLSTPSLNTTKTTTLDTKLSATPIIKKQNDFNITGLFADIFKGATSNPYYDTTPNPL